MAKDSAEKGGCGAISDSTSSPTDSKFKMKFPCQSDKQGKTSKLFGNQCGESSKKSDKNKKGSDKNKGSKRGKPKCHSSHEQFRQKIGCDKFSKAEADNECHHSYKAFFQSKDVNDNEKCNDFQNLISQKKYISQCDSPKDFVERSDTGNTTAKEQCLDSQGQCCQSADKSQIGAQKTSCENKDASKATDKDKCLDFQKQCCKSGDKSANFESMGVSKTTTPNESFESQKQCCTTAEKSQSSAHKTLTGCSDPCEAKAKVESLASKKQYCKSADEGKSKQKSKNDCSDSRTKYLVSKQSPKCAAVAQAKPRCGPSASLKEQAQDKPCNSENVRNSGSLSSACSKISNYCKDFAKKYVNIGKGESKAPVEMQPKKAPCPPKVETGKGGGKACCVSTTKCPKAEKPSVDDFFPLDARNKQLNDCIQKYMKLDPSKVISQCSKFANLKSDLSDKCVKKIKEIPRQMCVGATVKETPAKKTAQLSQMIGPRTRQIMGRYAPSAGMYLVTSALLTVYVTEWRAVLKYVPLYTHLANEES